VKDIELCTQDNYVNCVKKANDRTLWRAMVVNLRHSKTARWMNVDCCLSQQQKIC